MTTICGRCHVEVDKSREACPLCSSSLTEPNEDELVPKYPTDDLQSPVIEYETDRRLRFEVFELVSVLGLLGILITLFTDLLVNKNMTWSRFPLLAITITWMMVSVFLGAYPKMVTIGVAETIILLAFLAILDYFIDWQMSWFIDLGFPIILLTSSTVALVVYLSARASIKSINIGAYTLFGAGILTTGLDLIVNRYLYGQLRISWSRYVIVPVTMFALFFLYLHHRFFKHRKWRESLKAKLLI